MSSANDFDFLLGSWNIRNRRRTNAFRPEKDGVWQEFAATHRGEKYLDGRVIIDHFAGTLPDGEIRKGMTIRAFDQENQQWSLRWLDNRNPLDFSPLVGGFQDKVGLFFEDTTAPNGQTVRVRFSWDQITAQTARWQQAFSFDNGKSWDTNWIMEFTR